MVAAPFVKWAGGKRQLLPVILPRLPVQCKTYIEPFLGGGAVFFAMANAGRFKSAILSDANRELVEMYIAVRDDLEDVVDLLRGHAEAHSEQHFYEQRALLIGQRGPVGAARFIYLNRTCFNGLFRVNKAGEFNVSFGRYTNPRIVDGPGLEAASRALQGVEIWETGFETALEAARGGDAAYLDPPYLAVSKSAGFAAFHKDAFGETQHEALALAMGAAAERGAHVLLSNSDTEATRRIFGQPGRTVEVVGARRNINSAASKRGAVGEILVSIPVLSVKKKARAA